MAEETVRDLSQHHSPIGELFSPADSPSACEALRLTDDQVRFYHENGYLEGVRILSDDQVEALRKELSNFFEPGHEGNQFWYEYHTNESTDPDMVLFHALGAWRIAEGFHDLLWNPAFTVPASQLLGGAVRFWHDQLFCKPPRHGGVDLGLVAQHQEGPLGVAHLQAHVQ